MLRLMVVRLGFRITNWSSLRHSSAYEEPYEDHYDRVIENRVVFKGLAEERVQTVSYQSRL